MNLNILKSKNERLNKKLYVTQTFTITRETIFKEFKMKILMKLVAD